MSWSDSTGRRYFLGMDGSSHEYLVPLEKHSEWSAWAELDEEDEASWEAPDWAIRIDGGPLTFSHPRIGADE